MQTASETPRMYRSVDRRLLAGVGGGLARHLGVDVTVVRLALVALGLGGVGVAIYAALIFFVPPDPAATPEQTEAEAESRRRRRKFVAVLGYAALAVGFWVLFAVSGGVFDPMVWFIVFGVLGGAVLWYQANPAQRDTWVRSSVLGRRNLIRVGAGVALIIVGVVGFLAFRQEIQEARQGLSATAVVLVGMGMVAAPWIVSLIRERDQERRERIRSQERAEFAAHIHDSVLQTLALIQRRAEDSKEVQRLARVQERTLRAWLYQKPADAEATLAPALERTAAELEEVHGAAIEVVRVGDCELDDDMRALVQAAREAMVNAAKYAGVDSISVYAEVEPEEVLVFVRDRGAGFDLAGVPEDRMGVKGSIIGRMERHGGSAKIRTAPGEGTEAQLRMPRPAAGA